jgi:SulP family sulfate permease
MHLIHTCRQKKVQLLVCGLMHQPLDIAQRSGVLAPLDGALAPDLPTGLQLAIGRVKRLGQ